MEIYDYIVVGAGSAGCAIASRLSENPSLSVLLIEAGPRTDNFWVRTPAGMGMLFMNRRYNWAYSTQPVPTLGGRSVYWPRGKGLGGSSAINGMIYMRGQAHDYDRWAQLGNPGWGWRDVLPYFIRSETNARGASEFRGGNGPLCVSDPAELHPTVRDFVEAARNSGIPRSEDLNAPPHPSVGFRQYTIKRGRRHTAYDAFIAPVRHRRNLSVLTDTQVLRVLLSSGAATGVEVLQGGQRRRIAAAREVVLSGGALASPQLLMLSGIGEPARLHRHGIATQLELPGVGCNLQDHWYASFAWRSTPQSSVNHRLRGVRKYLEGARYLMTRGGYLAMGAAPVIAYVCSEEQRQHADVQLSFSPLTFAFSPSGEPLPDKFAAVAGSMVMLTPESRGHMDLSSADPLQAPAFHPNYLSHPDDIRRSITGMRHLRRIAQTRPLASRLLEEIKPGPAGTSDEQLLDYLKSAGGTAFHPVGTCKMGNDPMAVVDARLRVRGIHRLRVMDASIMPTIVTGNTHAPCVMIGERGADMIREDAVPPRVLSASQEFK
ncbi:MAG: GMC family oxidoreductase N-terminal domain-containing protein [Variovorax sp.]|nr:GMC family oxidoreductase N-terminal domain-containing protein [Variovorax sp.]